MAKPASCVLLRGDTIIVDGKPLDLQNKSARVLAMLLARAPEVVSRADFIDAIWSGNYMLGERGLNQALWSIRAVLGDNARRPDFIRTVPREGYQWLPAPESGARRKHTRGPALAVAASACATVIGLLLATASQQPRVADPTGKYALPAQCKIDSKRDVTAYQLRNNVVVDIENGCRLIAKPSGDKIFGEPVVSADGKHVAFTVTEEQSCHFVSVALQNGTRTEFERC